MPKWWNKVRNTAKTSIVNKLAHFPLTTILFLIVQFKCIFSFDEISRRISRQTNNWKWYQANNMNQIPSEIPVTRNFLPSPPDKIERYIDQNHFSSWSGGGSQREIVSPPALGEAFWTRRYSKSRQRRLGLNYRKRILNRSYIDASQRTTKRIRWRGLLGSTEEIEEEEGKGSSDEYGTTRKELSGVDSGDCSLYPNNTFNAPFAYACETRDEATGIAPPMFVVHEAAFANETGDYVYPLDFAQTLRIFLDVTSYATRRYDNMRAEVFLYRRKTGWMGCGWSIVPTFGTLDSLEICEESNPSCPVYPGRQVLEMKMEPSPVVNGILRMFYDDRVPYQMRVRVLNNRRRGEELFCVVFQARIEI